MEVRIAMCRHLPDEVQEIIWRKYVKTKVVKEIDVITTPLHHQITTYDVAYENTRDTVKHCVGNMYRLYVNNPLYFAVLLDITEERVLDDIYSSEGLFTIICHIRRFVSMPSLLAMELLHGPDFSKMKGIHRLQNIQTEVETINRMMFPYDGMEE